jgi:hypothetical protein
MLFSKHETLTTTDTTTIFEVPNGYSAHWNLLFISNHGGSTNNVTIFVDNDTDGDGTYTDQFYVFDGKQITSKDFLQVSDAVFVLHPTDRIRAATSSAGDVTVLVTFDLIYTGISFSNFNTN